MIIATVARPEFLRRAIASVLANSYQHFEIIVTDDANSAANLQIVASFNDSRIRYRSNSSRLGSALNHREALKLARGAFVGLLNDDDEWDPRLLEMLVAPLTADPDVVLAFADHYVIDSNGVIDLAATEASTRRWKRDVLAAGLHRPFFELALLDQSVPMVAALVRRDAIAWDDSPPEVGALFDFWVTYLACRTGRAACYVPDRLARYRVHPLNDTVVSDGRNYEPLIFIHRRMLDDPALTALRRPLHLSLARAKLSYAMWLIRNGEPRRARAHLWAPLRSGDRARAAAALALSLLPSSLAAALIARSRATHTHP